jgi:hypothetical protein
MDHIVGSLGARMLDILIVILQALVLILLSLLVRFGWNLFIWLTTEILSSNQVGIH